MNAIIAIFKKEILDGLRDGKSLSTAFLIPIIFSVVTFGATSFLASMQTSSGDFSLPIENAERIAPLVEFLKEQGIKIEAAPEDPESALLNMQHRMVLSVPDDFNETFREQKSARLDLLYDRSRNDVQAQVNRLKMLINQWSSNVGALRLISRGVSPEVATPIRINDINVTSEQRLASKMLSGLPMFILMIAFASGIGMVSDMASGERERKSLEPLLINPVAASNILLGKWAAAVVVTFVVAVVGIGLQFFSIHMSPTAELGLRLDLNLDEFLLIFAILIPVIFFASALQLVVSFFAKSFKDAQAYSSMIVLIPMAPGLYLTFNSVGANLDHMFVPMLGPTSLIVEVVSGSGLNVLHWVVASIVSIGCALICLLGAIKLLSNEKTLFN